MRNWLLHLFSPKQIPQQKKAEEIEDEPSLHAPIAQPAAKQEGNAHKTRGDVFLDEGAWAKAITCYQQALDLNPGLAAAHSNLGFALSQVGQIEQAEEHLNRAIALNPAAFNSLYVLANIAHQTGRIDMAIKHLDAAISIKPDFAEAINYLGNLYMEQDRHEEAFHAYTKALAVSPAMTEVMCNIAGILQNQGKRNEAIAFYRQSLSLAPDSHSARLNLLHQLFQTCEWNGVTQDIDAVRRSVRDAPASIENRDSPFSFLALPGTTCAEQKRCAEKWAYAVYQPQYRVRDSLGLVARSFSQNKKPHIAYLSADFHDHATARLMSEVFELHDRDRYTITAYSYGPDDASPMSERLKNAFDNFVDIRGESYVESAQRIHADQVDILVDLKAYTGGSRSAILALEPAPIQVNYLGYPGTMGADFVDYLIADRFVIPPENQVHYSEKIVYLPDTYQPNDRKRPYPPRPERSSVGLPEKGIVFCCFNQTYKITPAIFTIWCKLLNQVPDSVLWLIGSDAHTQGNLLREAGKRGVVLQRILFAERVDPTTHLARQQCADLFLDTVPYNAHTTCSDALWMGLPVITLAQDTFPSRVAGSLLCALGMPELVTYSEEAYYALALELATDETKRRAVKHKILANRDSTPLFDSHRFTRHLEQAYEAMLSEQTQHHRRVRIVIISPDGYAHSEAFSEIAETVMIGLRDLGYDATIAKNSFDRHTINIVFGANLLTPGRIVMLPRKTIIYNLEQIYVGSPWLTDNLLQVFQSFTVWDYSQRNVAAIRTLIPDASVKLVPVGYVGATRRIEKQVHEDIDVLFYGSVNARRQAVIDTLKSRGVKVEVAFNVYGKARDMLIGRAKLVLNMRLYDSDIFEIVRVSFLLANQKTVVSEYSASTDIEDDMRDAVALASYDKLADTCIALLADKQRREEIAERGFRIMASRKEADYLLAVMPPLE